MADRRKVKVTTGYGSTGQTSVTKLRRVYRRQSEIWKYNFFYNLLNNGQAEAGGFVYELLTPDSQAKTPNNEQSNPGQ